MQLLEKHFLGTVIELRKKLLEAAVSGYPKDRYPYTLTTDASMKGIGAILAQKQRTEDRVIAYASQTLSQNQRNYSATKPELFAIVHLGSTLKTIHLVSTFVF